MAACKEGKNALQKIWSKFVLKQKLAKTLIWSLQWPVEKAASSSSQCGHNKYTHTQHNSTSRMLTDSNLLLLVYAPTLQRVV